MIISKGSKIYNKNGDEYIVEELIGSGGFATVFKIMNVNTKKFYALKTFSSAFSDDNELNSFKNEISKAMLLNSENVVRYLFFNDGVIIPELPPFIIMEYCEEGTLEDYLKKKLDNNEKLTNAEIKELFLQLINGMEEINKQIVHRDIKLSNVLIKDGIIKISDFGISKSILEKTRTLTFKGVGTPEYYAPESWRSEKNTIGMDMYAMGIVFYQIATNLNYPYKIEKNTQDEYRNAHLYQHVIKPSVHNKELEINLESIILKMLEKDVSKRFDKWEEIKKMLENQKTKIDSSLVKSMLKNRITKDEEERAKMVEEQKEKERMNEMKKIISYSIYENIYLPIKDLVKEFNENYASGEIVLSDYIVDDSDINDISVLMPSKNKVIIKIKTIVDETFNELYRDAFFDNNYEKEYRPRLEGKEILAWGSVNIYGKMSYNLILTKDDENIYGNWYQLKNKVSALSRERRMTEIFAFEMFELIEEIKKINCMHIYNSEVKKFDINELLKWFLTIV